MYHLATNEARKAMHPSKFPVDEINYDDIKYEVHQ